MSRCTQMILWPHNILSLHFLRSLSNFVCVTLLFTYCLWSKNTLQLSFNYSTTYFADKEFIPEPFEATVWLIYPNMYKKKIKKSQTCPPPSVLSSCISTYLLKKITQGCLHHTLAIDKCPKTGLEPASTVHTRRCIKFIVWHYLLSQTICVTKLWAHQARL